MIDFYTTRESIKKLTVCRVYPVAIYSKERRYSVIYDRQIIRDSVKIIFRMFESESFFNLKH